MFSGEKLTVSHGREEIPFFVKQAAKLVPVGDYLQIRYWHPNIQDEEIGLLFGAAEILKVKLNPEEEILPPKDLRVKWARGVLEKIPLNQYLFVKRTQIIQAMEVAATDELLFGSLVGFEEEKSRSEEKRKKLANQFDVINTIIWKADVSSS